MRLSFLPGELRLVRTDDGSFVVTIIEQIVLKTRSKREALDKYNELRGEMESKFPTRELTPEEKAGLLYKEIGDALVGHNSLGGRKKKTTAGSTRTFGG